MIVINSPANPTGGVLTREDLERIAELALGTTSSSWPTRSTGGSCTTAPSTSRSPRCPGMAERTIVLDGFSKTYAMTGWRLGYAIVPDWLLTGFGRLIINSHHRRHDLRPVRRGRGADRARRTRSTRWWPSSRPAATSSWTASTPSPACAACGRTGAFYVFPDIAATGLTGAELAERLLPEAGVSVLAGTAFGGLGTHHIRLSYANSRENLRAGLERMRTVIEPLVAVNA